MEYPADLVRIVEFALFGFVVAQTLVINIEVERLRRDPVTVAAHPSLLAWHIRAVTIYSLGVHAGLLWVSFDRLGEPTLFPAVHIPLVIFGVVGNISMALILRVIAQRRRIATTVLGDER